MAAYSLLLNGVTTQKFSVNLFTRSQEFTQNITGNINGTYYSFKVKKSELFP
jgi:hypothetical protein